MRWFRSHSFALTSLALFALACQFVLSFGHVHLDRTAGFSAGRSIAAAVGSVIAAPAGKVTLADLPTSPKERTDSLGDDFCAICANISLAAAIVLPIVLLLLLGTASSERLIWYFAATRAASTVHVHFDARGPPSA
jgi:hypothetical protein